MEIKAKLEKPYTERERLDFIVENNHNLGYVIKEEDFGLEAWGLEDSEILERAREEKYKEALEGAKDYISSGSALYEFSLGDKTYHIEATDGNIAKTGLKAIALTQTGDPAATDTWNTKEDENIELNAQEFQTISLGLGEVQREVWTVKFPAYVEAIDDANTIEEIKKIVINYGGDNET